jgi:hypothetical protein
LLRHGVGAEMANNRLGHTPSLDQAANATPWVGGVVADDGQSTHAALHQGSTTRRGVATPMRLPL